MELGSLQSGIESTKVLGLQEGFHEAVKGKCLACWALRLCGVCFAAQAEYGASGMESLIVPDRVCEAVRRDQEATLKLLARILKLPKEMRGFLDESVLV
jgi:sulfatase maturation enzyme AslB (radical SAM superfamily)